MKKEAKEPRPPKQDKHPDWKMSKKERYWYYSGEVGRFSVQMLVPTFMNTFLIFQGIDLAAIAGITLFVKIIDAIDDVLFGFVVDKFNPTQSRFLSRFVGKGKYLPWFRLTFLLYPLFTVLLFLMPSNLSVGMKLVWFTVSYILYDLSVTVIDTPVQSMLMTLTDVQEERNSIITTKMILGVILVTVLGILWVFLISEKVGMSITSVVVYSAIIFVAMMLPLSFRVKEHNTDRFTMDGEQQQNYTFKDMITSLKANKYLQIMYLSTTIPGLLATGGAVGLFASYYLFGSAVVMTIPVTIGLIPMLIVQAISLKVCNKYGKYKVYIWGGFTAAALNVILYLVGYKNIALVIAVLVLAVIPNIFRTMAGTYMTPDCIEYARYKTGKDSIGISVAISSFLGKMTSGLSSSLGLLLLSYFGWVTVKAESFADLAAQNISQPPSAMTGLWILQVGIPAVGLIIGTLVMLAYKLNDKDAALMAKCNSGEITREECEAQLSRSY